MNGINKNKLSEANFLMRSGDYKKALELYLELLKTSPHLNDILNTNINFARTKIQNFDSKSKSSLPNLHYKKSIQPPNLTKNVSQRLGRSLETTFDPEFYLASNPDVMAAGVDPESHYFSSGELEGRKPNLYFDPIFYLRLYGDVRDANISAFRHFISNGFDEGRIGIRSAQDSSRSSIKKHLLFVGHDGIQAGSQVVLLEIIKWFSKHTTRKIKLLLLEPGPMVSEYAKYSDVYTITGIGLSPSANDLKDFLSDRFEFVYLNTVVSGRFFSLLKNINLDIDSYFISHIHEMEQVLEIFNKEMLLLLDNVDSWIAASNTAAEVLTGKYKIKKDLVNAVPAFITPKLSENEKPELAKFNARKKLDIDLDAFVVLGCGTVYWRKGPDIFLNVAKGVNSKLNKKIIFLWIGDGPDRESLMNSLDESSSQYIRFIGGRSDASELLASADLFFLSSREDPFPLVVLESAQYGIPSICFSEATGIVDFIQSDSGICLDSISEDLAIEAILSLKSERAKLVRYGRAARKKVFGLYTSEIQLPRIYRVIQDNTEYKPSVSIIVPFYNHENFVEERIESIFNQSIKDVEIIALDDKSTDSTAKLLVKYKTDFRFKLVINQSNSGSPFSQWEKGIAKASSEIVWIAEGDDSCSLNFIEALSKYFDDPLVSIAVAKTEVINEDGILQEGVLRPYMDMAYPGKYDVSYVKDGFDEVNDQLGAVCTLVNASAILFRKVAFRDSLEIAKTFKMCGDWLVYLECLVNGKIAYDVSVTNFFRRHSQSQVSKFEGTETYFKERERITEYVIEKYSVSRRLLNKAFGALDFEWARFKDKNEIRSLEDVYSKHNLRQKFETKYQAYTKKHVAFYVHGILFSKGGIERLAAQLSNYLVSKGWKVTIFCRHSNSDVAIYPLFEKVSVVPIFDETRLEESISGLREKLVNSDVDVFIPMLSEWLFDPIVEAASQTGIPVIVSEHNDPWKIEELWWSHESRVKCFEKATRIHLLLNKFRKSLPSFMATKIEVVPNGVDISWSYETLERKNIIISVGRLEKQKRFDRLIEAVFIIKEEMRLSGFVVEIYGEGSLINELSDQIIKMGVEDLISLKGKSDGLDKVYKESNFFILPSEFEGFGIVVVEAMSFGLPVLAFEECNGPNEIIRSGVDGYLVKDVNELANAISRFIKGGNSINNMRQSAYERSLKYSLSQFNLSWENLIINTIDSRQS
jgi:glycosyltransferase involved in cell wall biosynthesis